MRKILLFFICIFSFIPSLYSAGVLVEDIFSDISSDYEYRNELQALYDRGMIIPDESGKFSPNEYLNRDEFVGISMEVICERCIQPHTEFEFIEEFAGEDIYFDIDETNPYFYCVAEADKQNYVRGYDIGENCQDGTSKFDERPFCPLNRINLEEAVAVLLRNSGIFTINDNNIVVNDIRNGVITESISNDVAPTDYLGNPYTFYGYLKKALNYSITEYDELGNEKIYNLLEADALGNINPQEFVTKQEFLKMSYIALKSNNCTDIVENNLAIAIDIWEKTCFPGNTNCNVSPLDDPEDTYDFTPDVEGYCEAGIDDPNGYIWRFYNTTNGDEFFLYGTYLDDITLPSVGEWKVFLTVRDRCGNTGEVYSTIYVSEISDPPNVTEVPDTLVIIYPEVCDEDDPDCKMCEGPSCVVCEGPGCEVCPADNPGCNLCEPGDIHCEMCSGDDCMVCDTQGDICDITEPTCDPLVEDCSVCLLGETLYSWTISNERTGESYSRQGEYVDDFVFDPWGIWKIELEKSSPCGDTESVRYVDIKQVTQESLNVDILAEPIYGFEPLIVDFEGVVSGGTAPYDYTWSFGDAGLGVGKEIEHIYLSKGIYGVLLVVTDINGLRGDATVLIKVKEDDNRCLVDSDGDGIADCDDVCPTLSGPEENLGCPVFEESCDEDCGCPDGYSCGNSDPLTCGLSVCLPIEIPTSCLYTPMLGTIFGNALCTTCPCSSSIDFLADIRRCDLVFPAITSPDASSIYSRGDIWQVQ